MAFNSASAAAVMEELRLTSTHMELSLPARINKARGPPPFPDPTGDRCHVNLPDGWTTVLDLNPFCYHRGKKTSARTHGAAKCCSTASSFLNHSTPESAKQANSTFINELKEKKKKKKIAVHQSV